MNRLFASVLQIFQQKQLSVHDTFITLLPKDSRHVPDGFVQYDDTGNSQTNLAMDFCLKQPELLYEINDELMEAIAGHLSDLGLLLKSVHGYSYLSFRNYQPKEAV